MPKYLKYSLYFMGVYALILGLLALITSNSKCNILSSGSCGVFDAVYMVMLIPVVIPVSIYEEYKENKQVNEFIENRNKGVIRGDRESLESCVQFCHRSTQDSSALVELSKLASEKLIKFDDPKVLMTTDQTKAMIDAYANLQQKLSFSDPLKIQYVNRAWTLTTGAMENNEYYQIDGSSLKVIGGMAYLFNNHLMNKDLNQAESVFNQCMSDPFWTDAHFELFSLEVMNFCKVSLNWYLFVPRKTDEASKNLLKDNMENIWRAEWKDALKKKYPNKN